VDASGKLTGTGERYTLAADMVFKAIGQTLVADPLVRGSLVIDKLRELAQRFFSQRLRSAVPQLDVHNIQVIALKAPRFVASQLTKAWAHPIHPRPGPHLVGLDVLEYVPFRLLVRLVRHWVDPRLGSGLVVGERLSKVRQVGIVSKSHHRLVRFNAYNGQTDLL